MSEIGQATGEKEKSPQRVLFLPRNTHDAATAAEVFSDYEIELTPVDTLSSLIEETRRGADCLLLVEEALEVPEFEDLMGLLDGQPEWSDLPLIVATRKGSSSQRAWHLTKNANVTLIERPFRKCSPEPTDTADRTLIM